MSGVTCSAPLWAPSGNTQSPSWRSCSADIPNSAPTHRDATSSTAMAHTSEPFWSSWGPSSCPLRTSRRSSSFHLRNRSYWSRSWRVFKPNACVCAGPQGGGPLQHSTADQTFGGDSSAVWRAGGKAAVHLQSPTLQRKHRGELHLRQCFQNISVYEGIQLLVVGFYSWVKEGKSGLFPQVGTVS